MSSSRLALATLAGLVASFAFGFLVLWLAPALFGEARKYPAVFRAEAEMMAVMPVALVATLVAVLVAAVLFAASHPRGARPAAGARFGVLLGLLAVSNVLHDYVNFAIGWRLALGQAAAYFLQWTVVGIVVSLVYRPRATPGRRSTAKAGPRAALGDAPAGLGRATLDSLSASRPRRRG